jgi:hypothetical protein
MVSEVGFVSMFLKREYVDILLQKIKSDEKLRPMIALIILGIIDACDNSMANHIIGELPCAQVLDWTVRLGEVIPRLRFFDILAAYSRFELPFDDFFRILGLAEDLHRTHRNDRSVLHSLLVFINNLLDWCRPDIISGIIDVPKYLSKSDDGTDKRIYALVSNAYCKRGLWLGLTVYHFLDCIHSNKSDPGVRAYAAAALRSIVQCERPDLIDEMNHPESGIINTMMSLMEDLEMRVRHHMSLILLTCAKLVKIESLDLYCSDLFAHVSKRLLRQENKWITLAFISAWDGIFSVCRFVKGRFRMVSDLFLEMFPGDSIWDAAAVADVEVEQAWSSFLNKWFDIEVDEGLSLPCL